MPEALFKDATEKMNKAIEVLDHELGALRTGRASVHMLDGVQANIYNNMMPLNQIATISTPDASTVMIQPWDKNSLGPIEKAILQANIGMTPNNDGKLIRLHVPPLTEETRREMVKRAHALAEEGRVAIRNVRRHVNDDIKKRNKDGSITEDEQTRLLDRIQKLTDEHIAQVEKHLKGKEEEIMKV